LLGEGTAGAFSSVATEESGAGVYEGDGASEGDAGADAVSASIGIRNGAFSAQYGYFESSGAGVASE
jgi:hypothetical protein